MPTALFRDLKKDGGLIGFGLGGGITPTGGENEFFFGDFSLPIDFYYDRSLENTATLENAALTWDLAKIFLRCAQ